MTAAAISHRIPAALGRTRRAGVAGVRLAWGFAPGPLGLLTRSAAAIAALLLIAHHHRRTLRTALFYGGATAAVLGALDSLLERVPCVPLP